MRVIKRMGDSLEHYIRSYVITKLHQQRYQYRLLYRNDMAGLKRALRPGDVILVEGERLASDWIKVFSYHTWTHSALWVGDSTAMPKNVDTSYVEPGGNIVEALMGRGVILSNLEKYRDFNLRICRPVNLSRDCVRRAIRYALDQIGAPYDEDNLAQFIHFSFASDSNPTSPMGHLDQGRFTCSSLIAMAFESVQFPVIHFYDDTADKYVSYHASQVQPKDFDLSLNFQVIKTPALLAQMQRRNPFRRLVTSMIGEKAA
jgi:hypothetical protein